MSQANKGKFAEGKVQKWLEDYAAKHQAFDWERGYDAHSAGGRMQATVGDFTFYMPRAHGVIEVKELAHEFRLPSSRLSQRGKLRIRGMAGGLIMVLIYHTTLKVWRPAMLEDLPGEVPSWDLRHLQVYPNLDSAMSVYSWFPQ